MTKRIRNLYDPKSKEPFKLSRSKLELFLECPRCFYIDRRLGIGRVPGGAGATIHAQYRRRPSAQEGVRYPPRQGQGAPADDEWRQAYKRQMEIYQWLLRQRGFKVSRRGYFVYVNGRKDRAAFDGQLEFSVQILPYDGSDKWVEGALKKAHACLCKKKAPKCSGDCEWCAYHEAISRAPA